jgi:putative sigma-54 modulation protein
MQNPTASLTPSVVVRAINFELDEITQSAAAEKAARLLRYSNRIEQVCLELENDGSRAEDQQYIAKGKVDFGGPALLASVQGPDAARALDYLIDQLEHQLRRQQSTRHAPPRAGPARRPTP